MNRSVGHGEIRRKMNCRNACYYSALKLLASRLLSSTLKKHKTQQKFFSSVLYGFEKEAFIKALGHWTKNGGEARNLRY
jgi:hypothetical protein